MPFFHFDSWVNSETLSFLILLCVFSFIIYIIDSPNFWGRIESLKFGSSGVELSLSNAQKTIITEEKESQPEITRIESKKIKETSHNLYENFMLIYEKVEEKIRILSDIFSIEYEDIRLTSYELMKDEKIDTITRKLIQNLRLLRNDIAHSSRSSPEDIETATEIGEIVLSRLTLIYVQDVPAEKAVKFMTNSEKDNPRLQYWQGNSKTGKMNHVGIYYSVLPSKSTSE